MSDSQDNDDRTKPLATRKSAHNNMQITRLKI